MPEPDRFIRLPTAFLEAALHLPLTGTQWRVLLWIIRQTIGWNRQTTTFSWYAIAKDLALDRGGVLRAGQRLIRAGLIIICGNQIGLVTDAGRWHATKLSPQGEKEMTPVSDDGSHLKAMTGVIATDDASQRKRCQESSLFRRTKDSSKDRLKTYRKRANQKSDDGRHRLGERDGSEQQPLTEAATPTEGKYDGLSQD